MVSPHSGHVLHVSLILEPKALAVDVPTLGEVVDVHVSELSLAEQDLPNTLNHSGRQGHSDRPLLAIPTMVFTADSDVCKPSTVSAEPSGPARFHLRREAIASSCIEAVRQHFQAAGFSKDVSSFAAAPRRPSTNHMYDDRCIALMAGGLACPTSTQVATFLHSLFRTHGLAP